MKIRALASGSSGNCYTITDGKTTLLIECGLPFPRIKELLHYTTSSIAGCLISHSHGDHSLAIKDVIKAGINVYTSKGSAEALQITNSHRYQRLESKKHVIIGTLRVFPFDVEHDAPEPMGFVIDSLLNKDRVLFLTDSFYTKYRFPGITHILIECNYDMNTLEENVLSGRIDSSLRNRIRKSHMSLEQVIEILKANDLSRLKKVYLIHLSNANSNEVRMKSEIQKLTGVPVEVL